MNPVSPHAAASQARQLGIRLELDCRVPEVPDDDIQSLLQLVARHGVVCIDRQPLAPRELRDFAARWGELIELPAALAHQHQEPGLPSITRVGNVRPDGSIIPGVRFAEYWHHDGDFWAPGQNFVLNFLSSVHVPTVGGHTGFLDTKRAYDTLSESARADLDGAHIWVRASEIDDFKQASADDLPPDVRHPVLLRHPITHHMSLYLPDSPTGIQRSDGERVGNANTFVEDVCQRVGITRHEWALGDLVIVDNLQVMHRSLGGYGDRPRLLYRCQARMTAA